MDRWFPIALLFVPYIYKMLDCDVVSLQLSDMTLPSFAGRDCNPERFCCKHLSFNKAPWWIAGRTPRKVQVLPLAYSLSEDGCKRLLQDAELLR